MPNVRGSSIPRLIASSLRKGSLCREASAAAASSGSCARARATAAGKISIAARKRSRSRIARHPTIEPSEEDALHRPVEAHEGDGCRRGDRDPPPVPRLPPEPEADHEVGHRDHRELAALDTDVERDERGQELRPREAELAQDAGEPHAVEEAEAEHDRNAPGLDLREDQVLDGDVDDRDRDQRLDDAGGEGHDAVDREAERDRVGDRERGHLLQDRRGPEAQEEETEHEEDVVEPFRQDVGEPELEVLPDHLHPGRHRRSVAERVLQGRALALEPVPLDTVLSFFLRAEEVLADRAGEGPLERLGAGRDPAAEAAHDLALRRGRVEDGGHLPGGERLCLEVDGDSVERDVRALDEQVAELVGVLRDHAGRHVLDVHDDVDPERAARLEPHLAPHRAQLVGRDREGEREPQQREEAREAGSHRSPDSGGIPDDWRRILRPRRRNGWIDPSVRVSRDVVRRSMRRLVAIALVALSAPAAFAHDFWILPSSFLPAPGLLVSARLYVGVGWQGELVPRSNDRIVKFALVGPTGEQPMVGVDGTDPAGFARPAGPGLQYMVYQTNAAVIDLPADKIDTYIEEEGLEPFLILKDEEKAAGIKDHYARCAKSLLLVGKVDKTTGFDRKLGLPLELIPEANPYALPKGRKLPVRLLRDGKPLKGALVAAIQRDAPSESRISSRTDAKGRVVLPLSSPGVWLVKAVHIARAEKPGEWNSLWASLTFEVPGRPQKPGVIERGRDRRRTSQRARRRGAPRTFRGRALPPWARPPRPLEPERADLRTGRRRDEPDRRPARSPRQRARVSGEANPLLLDGPRGLAAFGRDLRGDAPAPVGPRRDPLRRRGVLPVPSIRGSEAGRDGKHPPRDDAHDVPRLAHRADGHPRRGFDSRDRALLAGRHLLGERMSRRDRRRPGLPREGTGGLGLPRDRARPLRARDETPARSPRSGGCGRRSRRDRGGASVALDAPRARRDGF